MHSLKHEDLKIKINMCTSHMETMLEKMEGTLNIKKRLFNWKKKGWRKKSKS